MTVKRKDGIELTQCGQRGPYQDSIHTGTVTADNEQEARNKLAELRHVKKIYDFDDEEFDRHWSAPHFTEFEQIGDARWKFRIVEEYTG